MKRAPRRTAAPGVALPAWLRALWLALLLSFAGAGASAQQRYWYDGDQRRPLWSDAEVVADFSAPGAQKTRVLKPAAIAKREAAGRSPVFRDSRDGSGAARALPGGVIVRFHASTSDAQRRALLARYGLEPARELGDGSGLWLVGSEPGLPSLDLANRLYESGDFAAAAPNWWQPRALK